MENQSFGKYVVTLPKDISFLFPCWESHRFCQQNCSETWWYRRPSWRSWLYDYNDRSSWHSMDWKVVVSIDARAKPKTPIVMVVNKCNLDAVQREERTFSKLCWLSRSHLRTTKTIGIIFCPCFRWKKQLSIKGRLWWLIIIMHNRDL